MLPPSESPYYFLAYDGTTLKAFGYVSAAKGGTKCKWTLKGFTNFLEATRFAAANNIMGLPEKDPSLSHP